MSTEYALILKPGLRPELKLDWTWSKESEYILQKIMRIFLFLLFYSDEIMIDYSLVKLNEQ